MRPVDHSARRITHVHRRRTIPHADVGSGKESPEDAEKKDIDTIAEQQEIGSYDIYEGLNTFHSMSNTHNAANTYTTNQIVYGVALKTIPIENWENTNMKIQDSDLYLNNH